MRAECNSNVWELPFLQLVEAQMAEEQNRRNAREPRKEGFAGHREHKLSRIRARDFNESVGHVVA